MTLCALCDMWELWVRVGGLKNAYVLSYERRKPKLCMFGHTSATG